MKAQWPRGTQDWTREDANLEAEEAEMSFHSDGGQVSVLEDVEQVLRLTEKNFNRFGAAFALIRHA